MNLYIHKGKIPATQYGNWKVLRSITTDPALKFVQSAGNGSCMEWNEAGDAFLTLAQAIGLSMSAIGAMMGGWPGLADLAMPRDESGCHHPRPEDLDPAEEPDRT